jgi:SagB-type dehydrogenase family enzyme
MIEQLKSENGHAESKGTASPMLLSIRPDYLSQERVMISDPFYKNHRLIKQEDLFNILLDNIGNADEAIYEVFAPQFIDEDTTNHILHWWERKWHPSLEYYVWSRKATFFDSHDEDGRKREEALTAYEAHSPAPERLRPEGVVYSLPEPTELPATMTVGHNLLNRRTIRRYRDEAAPLYSLSSLLWHGLDSVRRTRKAAQQEATMGHLRSYGSAFDIYPVLYHVDGVPIGVYYYDIEKHELTLVREGNYRSEMVTNLVDHDAPMSASWTIMIVGDFLQYQWRYRHERALRNLYIEAGRVSQWLILTGALYGLASFPTPAMVDSGLSDLLALDAQRQCPIYSLTQGLDKRKLATG